MMTRRRFAMLLASLPMVGKLFAAKETLVDPRQWWYPTTVSPIQAATGCVFGAYNPTYFPRESELKDMVEAAEYGNTITIQKG